MENYGLISVADRTGHLDGRGYGRLSLPRHAPIVARPEAPAARRGLRASRERPAARRGLRAPRERRRPGAAYAPGHDKTPSKNKN